MIILATLVWFVIIKPPIIFPVCGIVAVLANRQVADIFYSSS
jgi:hypothetical protein